MANQFYEKFQKTREIKWQINFRKKCFTYIYAFRSLLEAGGVDRLMLITRHRQRFSSRVVKFASQVLYSMWVHQELREVYRKAGWKETDFVTKTIAGTVYLFSRKK